MKRVAIVVSLLVIFTSVLVANVLALENSSIVEIAKKYEGTTFKSNNGDATGQCKWFVQKVVREAGVNLGTGYRFCYLDLGTEISKDEATAGDIIQLDTEVNHNQRTDKTYNYTFPMHTAIILENYGNNTFKVIDSNFGYYTDYSKRKLVKGSGLTVYIHDWNPYKTAGDKLHVHFYRLGEVEQAIIFDFNGVGDIRLGDSVQKLEQVFGSPESVESVDAWEWGVYALPEGNRFEVFGYDGISFYIHENKVVLFTIRSNKYQSEKGVTAGSPVSDIPKLSHLYEYDEFIDGYCFLDKNNRTSNIYLDQNNNIGVIIIGFPKYFSSL